MASKRATGEGLIDTQGRFIHIVDLEGLRHVGAPNL
jgi:hypothetical protein